jgi:hypothetical protein
MKAIIDRATYRGTGASIELDRGNSTQAYLTVRVLTDKGEQVIVFTVNTSDLCDAMRLFK